MKKLLLLLFLSATTFASAQLVNVIELNTPSGSAYHVYEGHANGRFDYSLGSNVIVSASDVWIINGRLVTNDRHPDVDFPAAYEIIDDLSFPDLGIEGIWIDKTTRNVITVREQDFLTTTSFTPLVMAGFTFDDRTRTHYYRTDCDRHYRTYRSNDPFNPGRFLWSATWWSNWDSETNTGDYEGAAGIVSVPVANLSDLVAAIEAHSDSFGECGTCTGTDADYEVMNELVMNANAGYSAAGFNAWIDREGNELRWNRIARVGAKFVLSIGVGAQHEGTSFSYDCLEELLDAL